jgi:glycosylphosphatidylinositol deacylase
VRWFLVILAITALFIGPRKAYAVFDAAQIATGLIVLIRIGPRYWGGTSWSSTDRAKRGQ